MLAHMDALSVESARSREAPRNEREAEDVRQRERIETERFGRPLPPMPREITEQWERDRMKGIEITRVNRDLTGELQMKYVCAVCFYLCV